MRILHINCSFNGSTGKIMLSLKKSLEDIGSDALVCAPSNQPNKTGSFYSIESSARRKINAGLDWFFGLNCCFAKQSTKKLIKRIDMFNPDIVHLHNIHGSFVNISLLFNYLKKRKKAVVWTLHDCWAFTGRCPHFVLSDCDRWGKGCYDCKYPKSFYPRARIDKTAKMWSLKKQLFSGFDNMRLVCPSVWLSNLVSKSFLGIYPIVTINNGIDLNIFYPNPNVFREAYKIPKNDFVILGVAFGWGKRKGLDVFVELRKRLPDNYSIVLVGTDKNIDKSLPNGIISIHRTNNQKELADIYSSADVFANPTREEVLGLVNIESLACGTPVVTFNTGGSPECLDEKCGSVVECDDVESMASEIVRICNQRPYSKEDCIKRAQRFDEKRQCLKYIKLYQEIIKGI